MRSVLLFGLAGPAIAMAVIMLPMLPLLWLASPILQQAVALAYIVGAIPAALTGAFVAVMSRLMPPPAPVSFYFTSALFGGCAGFVAGMLMSTPGVPSQGVGVTAVAGLLATLVCVRVASTTILGREQAH